ncbi:MAG: yvqK [Clostridia bacterium]|nr:yvqK [Clostridia bacterium]
MKIYTKTGDKGTTSDVLGQRISKADIKMELQGSIDEINAGVGYLRALIDSVNNSNAAINVDEILRDIQYTLFRIGSDVSSDFSYNYVKESDISVLENSIDVMTNAAGQLQNFIYYSGNQAAAYCQVVRSVVRRTERVFVRHMEGKEYNLDYQFINRLSDFLFTLARYINYFSKVSEEIMKLR